MSATVFPPVHSTGDPVQRDKVVAELYTTVLVSRSYEMATGASITPTGRPYSGNGIMVALPEHGEQLIGTLDDVLRGVVEWVDRVAPEVTGTFPRPKVFGAWVDHGILYLDVSEVFPADQRNEAIRAGRRRNQIAVWDNGRQEEIPTGGTGELQR